MLQLLDLKLPHFLQRGARQSAFRKLSNLMESLF